jgi:hypothetical protein
MVDNTQLDKRHAEMHSDPPNIKYTPLIENDFLKKFEIYSNISLDRECP